jgi:glyoxylase-like metal-dependent hydrolase (beta-lactamase superfamily II)
LPFSPICWEEEQGGPGLVIDSVDDANKPLAPTPGRIFLFLCVVFTGDALFIGRVNRRDLSGGFWPVLLQSIYDQLPRLPDDTLILPGRYEGSTFPFAVRRQCSYNSSLLNRRNLLP